MTQLNRFVNLLPPRFVALGSQVQIIHTTSPGSFVQKACKESAQYAHQLSGRCMAEQLVY